MHYPPCTCTRAFQPHKAPDHAMVQAKRRVDWVWAMRMGTHIHNYKGLMSIPREWEENVEGKRAKRSEQTTYHLEQIESPSIFYPDHYTRTKPTKTKICTWEQQYSSVNSSPKIQPIKPSCKNKYQTICIAVQTITIWKSIQTKQSTWIFWQRFHVERFFPRGLSNGNVYSEQVIPSPSPVQLASYCTQAALNTTTLVDVLAAYNVQTISVTVHVTIWMPFQDKRQKYQRDFLIEKSCWTFCAKRTSIW